MSIKALKIFAAASAAVLSISIVMPARVQAKEVIDNGDFKYIVSADGKSAEIVSYVGQSLYVSVPAEIDHYEVTSIGAASFKDNEKLKELDISGKIKVIDTAAFAGCTSLNKVHISGTVKTIGESAFSGCTSLRQLSIDDGIQTIGKYAFSECSSLQSAVIPNSVDHIGDYAFINCTSLEKTQIPKNLRYFGGYALENTKWMKAQKGDFVIVGDGLLIKYIGESDIKSIPDKVKTIGSYSFAGNKNIKNVMIPSSVSVIQNSAFEGCENLNDIYMPASVERIGQRAFFGCKSLVKIDLTDRLSLIDSYSFAESGLEELTIPKNVSVINKGAFEECRKLSSVSFGSGVKKIGEAAFKGCTAIKRLIFPENISEIEKDAFAGCTNLLRAEFSGDTKLHELSFSESPHMTAAVFYKNPKTLEDNAFNQIPELIIYSDNNLYLDEYAARNSKTSDNIKNLPQYNEYIDPDKNKEDKHEFSVGYTLITVVIIIVDVAVIGLFAFYIVVVDPKRSAAKQNAEYMYVQHRSRPHSPMRQKNNSTKNHVTEEDDVARERRVPSRPARYVTRSKPPQNNTEGDVTFASSERKKKKPISKPKAAEEEMIYVKPQERKTRPVQGKGLYGGQAARTQRHPIRKQSSLDAPIPQRKTNTKNKDDSFASGDTMVFRKPKK